MSERIERTQHCDNFVWIDLEMTGLDVMSDVILQAALVITDVELKPLEEFVCDIWQPEEKLALMTPFVRDMHEKNGLIKRVRQSRIDVGKAERELLERVAGWCPYGAVVCGNSIWQDRKYIDRYMPALGGYMTYRMVDVSALKVLAQRWQSDAVYKKPTEGAHDALFDVKQSIAELRHYREQLLK